MSEQEGFIQYPDETVGDVPPEPAIATPVDLIYGLEAKPPLQDTLFAAVQHILASFVGIITPSLIIGDILPLLSSGRSSSLN